MVMSTSDAPNLINHSTGQRVETPAVYSDSGAFAPARTANAKAALWLLMRSRADIWHFVFAPNPMSSRVGRVLSRVRRVPVVQTIASPPLSFEHIGQSLFGDVVVAQSQWTRERILCVSPGRVVKVVPPVVAELDRPSHQQQAEVRRKLGLSENQPVLVYPGDLETSRGAEVVAQSVDTLAREIPEVVVVFAYRAKTERAPEIRRRLEAKVNAKHARFAGDLTGLLPLLATSSAVLFPVDDLSGKVDLPISLLEAMALGVPVVTWDWGPLQELEGTIRVPLSDSADFVRSAVRAATDVDYRGQVVDEQRAAVGRRYAAGVVARAYESVYADVLAQGATP